ncbi:MAG: methyltransferase domain-containing protein [Luteolibacter sp.]
MASPHGWDMPWAWGWCVLGIIAMAATVFLWHRDQLDLKTVLIGAVLFRLFMLPFPPLTSDDFFRYLWDGLVQHQGDNPYHHLPSSDRYADLHALPEYTRSNSKDYHSVYPPLSQAVFYVAAAFRDWGFQASYIVLKLQWMLLEIAGIWALSRMVSARDLMLYAWNPLIIIAVVGQGHTEAGMVGLILLSLYLVARNKPGLASITLAAAGWIKLYPFLLFPFLVSRFGFRKIWPGALVATALGWAYLDATAIRNLSGSLTLYLSYFEYNSGIYFALREIGWKVGWLVGLDDPRPAITYGLALAFALIGLTAWWQHHRRKLALAPAVMLVFAAYLVCSRTVHPWYLSGVLCLLPLVSPVWRWPWLWLAAGSWGTYLLYVDGTYWLFVFIGWIGWTIGLGYALTTLPANRRAADRAIQSMLRKRATDKARTIDSALAALKATPNADAPRILDIGAAEGYLGEELARCHNAHVELVDIGNGSRSKLPHHIYDGHNLPFPDGNFDAAILYFVLHHADDADQVLREARRVTTRRVIIVESWARGPLRKRALLLADRLANALRGGRWRDPIHYRTPIEWIHTLEQVGFHLIESRDLGGWFHAKQLFVIEPSGHFEHDLMRSFSIRADRSRE